MTNDLSWRTGKSDMATERHRANTPLEGVCYREQEWGAFHLCALTVESDEGAKRLGKPRGRYFSIHCPAPALLLPEEDDLLCTALCDAFRYFLPKETRRLLVAGLGNRRLTADSLGPLAADGVAATAAIPEGVLSRLSLGNAPRTFVLTPDVFAETGIESTALIKAAVNLVKPDALLVFDALAASDKERLLKTVEMTDTGTVPGGGVKNAGEVLSRDTVGVFVLSVGVPTVVREEDGFLLVPHALEEGVRHIAHCLSRATECALEKEEGASTPILPFSSLFSRKG